MVEGPGIPEGWTTPTITAGYRKEDGGDHFFFEYIYKTKYFCGRDLCREAADKFRQSEDPERLLNP